MSISDTKAISLMYQVQHSHILQVEVSAPASVFPLVADSYEDGPIDLIVKILFTKHHQDQRLEFTGQHYTTVAEYFMTSFLDPL